MFETKIDLNPMPYDAQCNCIKEPCDCSGGVKTTTQKIQNISPFDALATPLQGGTQLMGTASFDLAQWISANKTLVGVGAAIAVVIFLASRGR